MSLAKMQATIFVYLPTSKGHSENEVRKNFSPDWHGSIG